MVCSSFGFFCGHFFSFSFPLLSFLIPFFKYLDLTETIVLQCFFIPLASSISILLFFFLNFIDGHFPLFIFRFFPVNFQTMKAMFF